MTSCRDCLSTQLKKRELISQLACACFLSVYFHVANGDRYFFTRRYVGIYIHLSMPPFYVSAQVVHKQLLCRKMTRYKSNRLQIQKTPLPVILIALLNASSLNNGFPPFRKEKTLNAHIIICLKLPFIVWWIDANHGRFILQTLGGTLHRELLGSRVIQRVSLALNLKEYIRQ